MDVNITIKAKVLVALWAANMEALDWLKGFWSKNSLMKASACFATTAIRLGP
jgi:hypothetical protein